MANIVKTVIQLRRAHTADWLANKDVVPTAGEPCFDLDLNTLKIGNGVDTYENLEPIGGVKLEFAADGKSIVLEDNVFKLMGFDAAEVGAQPRKNADGNIEWVVPSTETVDGLQQTVAGLQSDVTNLQSTVSDLREIVMPSEEGAGTLLDRVEALEGKVGEEDIDAKIDKKLNEFMNNITDDGTVNTMKELIDYVASHGAETADMAADILTLQELVGDTSVASQISTAILGKVDVEEGKSLVADTLIAKLEAIEEGAQVNKIEKVYVGDVLLDIVEKSVVIPIGAGIKTSEEITVAEDGTLGIGTISVSKLVSDDGTTLVLDGGGAAV